MKNCLLPSFLAVLGFASNSFATTLLIDFGNNGTNGVQTSSPDINGNFWNNSYGRYPINVTNLVATNNTATTIDLSYLSSGSGPNTGSLGVTGAPTPFNVESAYSDAIFTTNATSATGIQIVFTDLNPALTYQFRFFGSREATDDRTTNYEVIGSTTDSGSLQTSGINLGGVGLDFNIANTLVLGGESGISPNGTSIQVNVFANATDAARYGYLNAMEITVIPECSVSWLGCLGVFSLLRRRR